MSKVDHLRLCNDHGVPFQDFQAQFCSRCFQPECTRSQHGKSRFEARTGSWEDRLFLNVTRLDPQDERFQAIAGKKFLSVNSGPAAQSSAWVDPRDVEPERVVSLPSPPAPEPAPSPAPLPQPEPVMQVQPEEPQKPPQNPQVPDAVLRNTPNRSRQMIGGAEPPKPSPVLDPWQPKQALRPGEQVVQPGARVRFGK